MECPICQGTDVIVNEGYTAISGSSHISTLWECENCGGEFYAYYDFAYTEAKSV